MRKTFNIEEFKRTINESLANSTCSPSVRSGMIFALDSALHQANAYDGFRYLNQNEVAEDALPGVRVDSDGCALPFDQRFVNTDVTRVRYY